MWKMIRTWPICRMAGLLCASIVLGTIAMIGVYFLPTAPMFHHVERSIEIFETEGTHYGWANGKHSSDIDNFTNALMLQNAIFSGSGNAAYDAMLNQRFAYLDTEPAEALVKEVHGEAPLSVATYAHYWHGYLVILKPLLCLMDVSYLRILNLMVQVLLSAWLIRKLGQEFGSGAGTAYLLMYLFLNPVSLAMSFQFSTMFYIMSVMTVCMLRKFDDWDEKRRYMQMFLVAGVWTAFFDFLTYPFVSLGIPLVVFLMMRQKRGGLQTMSEGGELLLSTGVSWGIGYGGMFLGKWLVGWLLTGVNVPAEAMHQAAYRMSSQSGLDGGGTSFHAPAVWFKNFIIPLHEPVGLCLLLVFLFLAWKTYHHRKEIVLAERKVLCKLLGIVACYPFLWYAVLTNHSYMHDWFTYRELAITVFAVGMLHSVISDKEKMREEGRNG